MQIGVRQQNKIDHSIPIQDLDSRFLTLQNYPKHVRGKSEQDWKEIVSFEQINDIIHSRKLSHRQQFQNSNQTYQPSNNKNSVNKNIPNYVRFNSFSKSKCRRYFFLWSMPQYVLSYFVIISTNEFSGRNNIARASSAMTFLIQNSNDIA